MAGSNLKDVYWVVGTVEKKWAVIALRRLGPTKFKPIHIEVCENEYEARILLEKTMTVLHHGAAIDGLHVDRTEPELEGTGLARLGDFDA